MGLRYLHQRREDDFSPTVASSLTEQGLVRTLARVSFRVGFKTKFRSASSRNRLVFPPSVDFEFLGLQRNIAVVKTFSVLNVWSQS